MQNYYVISGGPGVGKTTVLNELKNRGCITVAEDARRIIEEQIRTEGQGLPWKDKKLYTQLMLKASVESYRNISVSREDIVLDIGIYGRSKKYAADKQGTNEKIERYATAHQSMKVLYSEVFYPEDEFWTIYDKVSYDTIRRKYHAENVFPDLRNKVRSKDTIKPTLSFGIPKLVLETVRGTYKNT